MKERQEPAEPGEPTPFEKFKELTRRVLSASKHDRQQKAVRTPQKKRKEGT
jgi:hypothetical protein